MVEDSSHFAEPVLKQQSAPGTFLLAAVSVDGFFRPKSSWVIPSAASKQPRPSQSMTLTIICLFTQAQAGKRTKTDLMPEIEDKGFSYNIPAGNVFEGAAAAEVKLHLQGKKRGKV